MIRKVIQSLIRIYQRGISPFLYPSCRYHPSCSNYALEALERFGALKGILLTIIRILTCSPLFEGGIDQVPLEWIGWQRILKQRINRLVWIKRTSK